MTPATLAALVVAFALYQATSLVLGPSGDREIALSLSTPSSLDLTLPAPPAVLEVGQMVASRVERSLASSFAVQDSIALPLFRSAAPSGATAGPTSTATVSAAAGAVQPPASGTARQGKRNRASSGGGHAGTAGGKPSIQSGATRPASSGPKS